MLQRLLVALGAVAFFSLVGPGEPGGHSVLPGRLSLAQAGEAKLKFEIYKDSASDYRWRLKDADDKVLATAGQSFSAKADCRKSVERIKNITKQKFEVYEDKGKAKAFRWRLKATNGQVVAASGGSYPTKGECESAIEVVKKSAPKAAVIEEKAKDK